MDNFLLQAAVLELREEALGLPVHRVVPEGLSQVTLLLGEGWDDARRASPRRRIRVSLDPALPLLHLTRQRSAPPRPPSPFHSALRDALEGARLTRVDKEPWQRAVRLRFARDGGPDRQMAVEMFGKRPNAFLLDEAGDVLALHHLAGGLKPGSRYAPPEPGRRVNPAGMDEETLSVLAAEGAEGFGRRLARRVLGWSPVLADELERSVAAGEAPWPFFVEWRQRAAAGNFDLRLITPPPDLARGGPPVLAPFPVDAPPGSVEQGFARAGEALDAYREACDGHRAREDRRASLLGALGREHRRLERLEEKLAADLARGDQSEALNRQASTILAGLGEAQVEGDRARLPDPFGEPGATVELVIDPKRSLKENADALFHRARKARRGVGTVTRRLEAARERLPRLAEAQRRAREARGEGDLESLEEELAGAGVLRLVRKPTTRKTQPPPGRAAEVLPVRSYTSRDGLEILMGRTGKENDMVTFRVAAPHDFWFHAQGYAGAHVVVRNPERLKKLPPATLEQAAMLAAFHSKARGAGRVEVMVTQRRHVRKGRGLPAGTVQVRRHETVRVRPEMPFSSGEV